MVDTPFVKGCTLVYFMNKKREEPFDSPLNFSFR